MRRLFRNPFVGTFIIVPSMKTVESRCISQSPLRLEDKSDGTQDNNKTPTDGNDKKEPTAIEESSTKLTEESTDEPRNFRLLSPRELMVELDKYIVGQADAKRAVSVALRNRWRRHKVPAELRDEISPKNILMIGPTGVGKTEIARRLAKLTDAPFIKVEATKFTEVGFHGRDVDSIIEDLYKMALSQTKVILARRHKATAREKAEERILQALAGAVTGFKEHLRQGALNDVEVTLDLLEKRDSPKQQAGGGEGHPGMFIQLDLPGMMGNPGGGSRKPRAIRRTLKIGEALPLVTQEELDKLVEASDLQKEALQACEENGIVVIDEIDKIVTASSAYKGHQASAEGVQQDLLPLIEGTTITTKNGIQIKTEKILFICSGAFHAAKPSDMLAELQGRLPIRVELTSLMEDDLYRVLTEPKYNLITQNTALLLTEGVTLEVTEAAKREIASSAAEVNTLLQNIGARRLITVTEKVLEDILFDASERSGTTYTIDAHNVKERVEQLLKSKEDMSKYLL